MIKLQEYTPEVYYKQSRDFQFIGRLYDLVLNSVKTNADMIYDIPSSDAAGSKMIDLLTLTLGFKARHNYNVKQLAAICSILPTILRNKGTLLAIKIACQALLNAEGITDNANIIADWTENPASIFSLIIYIPPALTDLSLLLDLLSYILPAGISCEIYRAIKVEAPAPKTISRSADTIQKYERVKEYDTDIIGVSMVPRGAVDLNGFDNPLATETTVVNPDQNYCGPITNSTVIRESDDSRDDEGE